VSSDAHSGDGGLPTDDQGDLLRLEGVTTTTETFPGGARHGGGGQFVLQDDYRPADRIQWDAGQYRQIPDGSLYQTARAARYALEDDLVEDSDGRERAVLSRSFEVDGEQFAVSLTDSRSQFGTGTGDDRTQWYKYDLTLQPLEDGVIQWDRTPAKSLNVKLLPQQDRLVYKDGTDQNPPYGNGTLVQVQCTWVEDPNELLDRAARLVQETLGYDLERSDVAQDSRKFWKAEVHHRVQEAVAERLAHTVRQSGSLLARNKADVDTMGSHQGDRWLEVKVTTREWDLLGFPISRVPILIKLYLPDHPETLEYPMDQPKLEVALAGGGPDGRMLHWDRWEEIHQILEAILLSHLKWGAVGTEDLVADDFSAGAAAEPVQWEHPDGRRAQLKEHYESLAPRLYHEATKPQTMAVYDILQTVQRYETVTYQTLQDETGLAYRTVREHVRRLCEVGGPEPGILERVQDAETWISFSSRFMEDLGADALAQCHPDDTPEDEQERAQERRQQRREDDQDAGPPDVEDRDSADDSAANTWRYFGDVHLSPEQLADALERDLLPPDHVRVRTDDSALFPNG
jgi:hypothetical protein